MFKTYFQFIGMLFLVGQFQLVIAQNGNVGIGTETPEAKLHINGSAIIKDSLKIKNSLGNDRFIFNSDSILFQMFDNAGNGIFSIGVEGDNNNLKSGKTPAGFRASNLNTFAYVYNEATQNFEQKFNSEGNGELKTEHSVLQNDIGMSTTFKDVNGVKRKEIVNSENENKETYFNSLGFKQAEKVYNSDGSLEIKLFNPPDDIPFKTMMLNPQTGISLDELQFSAFFNTNKISVKNNTTNKEFSVDPDILKLKDLGSGDDVTLSTLGAFFITNETDETPPTVSLATPDNNASITPFTFTIQDEQKSTTVSKDKIEVKEDMSEDSNKATFSATEIKVENPLGGNEATISQLGLFVSFDVDGDVPDGGVNVQSGNDESTVSPLQIKVEDTEKSSSIKKDKIEVMDNTSGDFTKMDPCCTQAVSGTSTSQLDAVGFINVDSDIATFFDKISAGKINLLNTLEFATMDFNPSTKEVNVQEILNVIGDLNVNGSKNFRIDHPLDPQNKFLYHSAIESPTPLNMYRGNIITDQEGMATVILPDYFQALNIDYSYHLTVIGSFAQAIIHTEVQNNKFAIQTSEPNIKVSWQIIGQRNDPYTQDHPYTDVREKTGYDKGKLLYDPSQKGPYSEGARKTWLGEHKIAYAAKREE